MRQRLLNILETNGKLEPKQIAAMLDLNEDDVKTEVTAMEKEGIILQYGALINWDKTGKNDVVTALIDVKVTPQRDVGFDELASKIYKYPEVQSLFLMSGSYDFSVQIVGKSLKDVAEFVGKKLAVIEGIHFVLKKYKVSHVILENNEKDRRQVIIP